MPNITLTVSSDHAIRLAAAFGRELGLGRPATLAEIKTYLSNQLKNMVQQRERDAAMETAVAAVTPAAEIAVT